MDDNDALVNLGGLTGLASVQRRLQLVNNELLDDVSELEDLTVGDGAVHITGNPALDQCAAQQLGDALIANGYAGDLTIENNLGDCPPP